MGLGGGAADNGTDSPPVRSGEPPPVGGTADPLVTLISDAFSTSGSAGPGGTCENGG